MLFNTVLGNISSVLTDTVLVAILLSAGIYLTFRTKFIQLRCLGEGLRNTFSGLFSKEKKDGISPFAALSTSLAAQLGTGNIVGAGSAILTGGPGAVFWIWLSSFFGMATAYCEAYFAQVTRKVGTDSEPVGGAAYYIRHCFRGTGGKILSGAFSLSAVCALGFTGVAVQSNSISSAITENTGVSPLVTGLIIAAASAFVIMKGTAEITRFSEKTVPPLAGLYFAVCLAVIILNIKNLPHCFYLIFTGAFSPSAVTGGITGITLKTVISQGIKRGLFTNEAGMGSTASAHALSDAPSPHYQGTLALTGVFTDTFIMMSLTAISIICVLFPQNSAPVAALSGSEAVCTAFSHILGEKGAAAFTCISVSFFAFASIVGWYLFGRSSCIFLFGEKSTKVYLISSLLFIFAGTVFPSDIVWTLTDIFNTFMVLTNVPALIKLSSQFC